MSAEPERAGTEKVPPLNRTHADEQVEHIARIIAFWHGAKVLFIKDGMNTVASVRGYGRWGNAPELYANDHWREYEQAAKAMLTIMDGINETAHPVRYCEHLGARLTTKSIEGCPVCGATAYQGCEH